ncbi:zinc finger MYM-type protein 1-like [Sipha flava]|uniref:Zinc finger MYM-type protein 1-like n=1 Tax=Sipha flava TaxID=143950 RepID=A0A8B8GRI6_9HEMI|nr:zinc finger MYM-type protein 1-like [Sipha flava]
MLKLIPISGTRAKSLSGVEFWYCPTDGQDEQNQNCKIYNEDGEPSDKSSNDIFNNSFEEQPVTELHSIPTTSSSLKSFNSNLSNSSNLGNDRFSRLDIGNFVNLPCTIVIDEKTKHELLTNIWTPEIKYSFKKDSTSVARCFRHEWLSTYSPWLSYSQKMKGPFCVFCVLFHSSSGHASTVFDKINTSHKLLIDNNRKKNFPIISSILFCGTQEIALRGKTSNERNFNSLINFRIEAGKIILSRITNYLVKSRSFFSILADKTADISGTEQLSIGIRYISFESENPVVKEEFLGFVALIDMHAKTVAKSIIHFLRHSGLNLNNLIGQGYDGCSAMSGIHNGVQAIIKNEFPKAVFVHCSSHRLNLVINDLNKLQHIQNCAGIINSIIKFFRLSPKRRKRIEKIPYFCETRWSEKYKTIRIFSEQFVGIVEQLEIISMETCFDSQTKSQAFQLHSAATKSNFIVCLFIMAKFSAQLEPITNALQAIQLDLSQARKYITEIIEVFNNLDAKNYFHEIFKKAQNFANELGEEIEIPRIVFNQKHRLNHPINTPEDYFRVSLYQPYCILWYNVWKNRNTNQSEMKNISFISLLDEANLYPAIYIALTIALTMPVTTCSVERTFITLRRVKTWTRNTIGDNRLNGLCMIAVHKEFVENHKLKLIEEIINEFGLLPRRMELLFND